MQCIDHQSQHVPYRQLHVPTVHGSVTGVKTLPRSAGLETLYARICTHFPCFAQSIFLSLALVRSPAPCFRFLIRARDVPAQVTPPSLPTPSPPLCPTWHARGPHSPLSSVRPKKAPLLLFLFASQRSPLALIKSMHE